jgi:hypothetical protein
MRRPRSCSGGFPADRTLIIREDRGTTTAARRSGLSATPRPTGGGAGTAEQVENRWPYNPESLPCVSKPERSAGRKDSSPQETSRC